MRYFVFAALLIGCGSNTPDLEKEYKHNQDSIIYLNRTMEINIRYRPGYFEQGDTAKYWQLKRNNDSIELIVNQLGDRNKQIDSMLNRKHY